MFIKGGESMRREQIRTYEMTGILSELYGENKTVYLRIGWDYRKETPLFGAIDLKGKRVKIIIEEV